MLFWLFLVLCSVKSSDYTVIISVSDVIQSVTSPFNGFTIDWWKSHDPDYVKQWGNTGFLTVNFSNPTFIALTKEIAPAILRISGSPQDNIIYNMEI